MGCGQLDPDGFRCPGREWLEGGWNLLKNDAYEIVIASRIV